MSRAVELRIRPTSWMMMLRFPVLLSFLLAFSMSAALAEDAPDENASAEAAAAGEAAAEVASENAADSESEPVEAVPASALMPAPFHAEYRVRVLIATGKAVLTLDYAGDDDYRFSTSLAATGVWKALARGGLSEVTVFDLEPDYPQTINYSLINEFGSRPRNGEYEFLWEEGVARGIYKEKPIELPINNQVMDRSLLPIRMMHDLASGRRPTTYTILDRDELVEIEMGYGEEKVIKVPYGKFTAMKIRHLHSKDDEESFIWVAPELGYLPVRLEQLRSGNRFMVADLVEYQSLAPASEVAQR